MSGTGAYDRWNEAIADEFFSGSYGGRPVYLDLEDETLLRLARRAGAPGGCDAAGELTKAARSMIALERPEALFAKPARRLAEWRLGESPEPPPVIALLGYMSLVAERMRAEGDLAASNYYGRFVSMLGGDPRDEELKGKVFNAFAQWSGAFWGALNSWLEERPEVRGIPTAYAFDHRSYVGPALSQALVRDSDRHALLELFTQLGLQPGQAVAVDDMVRVLQEWLPHAPISAGLKHLAGTDAVLSRIAEVACIELSAWTGGMDEARSNRSARIAVTAALRRLPRRSLRLGIAVQAPPSVASLAPGPECDEAGRAAVFAAGDSIRLEEADTEGWRSGAGAVGIADLLPSSLELVGDEGFSAHRQPRPVVVLAREGASDVYREVERVRLCAEHMLLAVESSRERLEKELETVARSGYVVHEELPGLPNGWLLYEGVEILTISETSAPDLAVLVPLAWTEISLANGMRLPGRSTWHVRGAPELKATAASQRPIDVLLRDGEQSRKIADLEQVLIMDLEELELEDGDYRIDLCEPGEDKVLSTVTMRLRSADAAAPADWPSRRGPGDGRLWPLTSEPGEMGVAEGLGFDEQDEGGLPDQDEEDEDVVEATVQVPSCYLSGAHYIVLPPAGRRSGGRPSTIEGSCKFCGLEKRFPARPPRGRHGARRRGPAPIRPLVPPRDKSAPVDYDLLLDALCAIGSGRAERVRALMEGMEIEPWTPAEALRTLSALGHLEVTLDRQLRPSAWRVAPPTIVLGEEVAFLAGFRSEELLYEIGHQADLRFEPQQTGPARIVLPDLTRAGADLLAEKVRLPVRVLEQPGQALAESLPSLLDLRAALPPLQGPPDGPVERLSGSRWVPTERLAEDGGYRTRRIPRVVWHRRGSDLRVAEARLVKWLTASPRDLLTIEPGEQVSCGLGAQPPWLYERALVVCSGLAPIQAESFRVLYQGAPSSVAEVLLRSMTSIGRKAHA